MPKSQLPPNVQTHFQKFSSRSKGSPAALEQLQLALEDFNKSRQQNCKLKGISVAAYVDQNHIEHEQLLVVHIAGRRNTYYYHKKLTFYMLISDGFPEEPPEIVVGELPDGEGYRRFLHLNFDHSGHVCMLSNQPGKEYYRHTSLKDLLIELENTIYCPNIGSSYPSVLYDHFSTSGSNAKYFKMLNEQAQRLPDLEESQLSDEEEEEL